MKTPRFVYFGGEPIGVPVLHTLNEAGLVPELIVCNPDRPVGRKQIMTPPPVKIWAQQHNVPVFQPEHIPREPTNLGPLTEETWDLFVVVAYNHILPHWFINLPARQTLNLHPSLLPKLRGASPIRSLILNDAKDECGASVIVLDEKMDHGPLIAQQTLDLSEKDWPIAGSDLDTRLGEFGGRLLAATIPSWLNQTVTPKEQDHAAATYSTRITKDMGELILDPHNLPTGTEAYQAFLKIQAYDGWPGTFFRHNGQRIKITAATYEDKQLKILRVVPEGKRETDFTDWLTRV